MITLRAAAGLLAHTDSMSNVREIAHAMGFTRGRRLTPDALRDLGLYGLVQDAEIARGPGRLRCLLTTLPPHLDSPATTDARELTRRVCLAIAAGAPARDWCVITLDASATAVCIAAVAVHPSGPRITALRVDRRRVVDSDADTLRALATATDVDALLRHARFIDILGRDALSTRFYRTLEHTVDVLATSATGHASADERRTLALLCASRCLFLAFLEAKGWLNHNRQFLMHHVAAAHTAGGRIHDRLLKPLFFGTLNTPITKRADVARAFGDIPFLNGGLFAPTALERRRHTLRFTDDALTSLLGDLLDRYRFTAHEDSTRWSEAAIDPEMLGRAFECLMGDGERHRSGSYYTPPALVEQVVNDALASALPDLPSGALSAREGALHLSVRTRTALDALRVLDPACGSGAFLVHTLECVAALRARGGDPRPIHEIRREVLTHSIFGVDANPMAVWLCELRLWLSIVIECPETRIHRIPPLPNLDHHIRLGDTLAGGTFAYAPPSARRLTSLRDRYTRATGTRKHTLAAALDREERTRAIAECRRRCDSVQHERAALLESLRTRDLFGDRIPRTRHHTQRLTRLRIQQRELTHQHKKLELGAALPFRFAAHFADVAADGGFSLIVGNPPWVRPHALAQSARIQLRAEFHSMRRAAWRAGAARAGAGAGFAAQADIAAAFVERSMQLLAPHGIAALLVPAKLWRALAGGGIREWLAEHARVHVIRDWSHAPALFDAAVYPSLLVAERSGSEGRVAERMVAERRIAEAAPRSTRRARTTRRITPSAIHVSIAQPGGDASFDVPHHELSLGGDHAAPWILLPPAVRAAFNRLRGAGPALGDSSLGRPTLGVKCGCNAAFLVHAVEHDDDSATIYADGRRAVIERVMLRPALRGDSVTRPRARKHPGDDGEPRILWTHDSTGAPLRTLPPATARWLSHWRPQLEARRDIRPRQPWWMLFRTESARHESPRVVWADIGRQLRPRVLLSGDPTVPLNSCYVMRAASAEDAWALHALLASPVAAAWFDALAEPARGGFRRFLGWTVATLPIPADWTRVRAPLADFARRRERHQQQLQERREEPLHERLSVGDAETLASAGVGRDDTTSTIAVRHVHADAPRMKHDAEYLTLIADAYGVPVRAIEPLVRWVRP